MAPLNELDKALIIPAIFASVASGACADSQYFEGQLQNIRQHTYDIFSFSQLKRAALEELNEVANEASTQGWDGYGANAIDTEAYIRAKRFLSHWPEELPFPELGAMPDGDVSLDWDFDHRRSMTILIGSENRIAYALINLDEERSGTLSYLERIPKSIISNLKELCASC